MAGASVHALLKTAAGFGRCPSCPYFSGGFPALCYACAEPRLEAPAAEHCATCELPITESNPDCGNPVCMMGSQN